LGDATTKALACQGCGTDIYRKSKNGKLPTRCRPCAQARQRAQNAANSKRRWAEMRNVEETYTCQDCGRVERRPNMMGPAQKRCPDCLPAWTAEQSRRGGVRAKARKLTAFLAQGRWSTCLDCGTRLRAARFGPLAQWCRRCYLKIRNWKEHTPVVPTPIVCLDCGKSVIRSAHGMARKRCNDCTRRRSTLFWIRANPDRRREISRRGRHVRRARLAKAETEKFSDLEIFERDRWKCGICKKRINKNLKHPHPKSVSLDHVIPISQGGPHTRANTRASHLDCNVRRQAKGGNEQLLLVG
jgi:hypothetical protein